MHLEEQIKAAKESLEKDRKLYQKEVRVILQWPETKQTQNFAISCQTLLLSSAP